MNITLLYFDNCPHYKPALTLLKEILKEEGISDCINEIDVSKEKNLKNLNFQGSPTIIINGKDIDESSKMNLILP